MSTDAASYVDEHFDDYLDDLIRLVEQPSISATGEGVAECTTLVEELCEVTASMKWRPSTPTVSQH